jgi:cation diffusion facilitator CzcD-associated flavoprotein CzcO
LKNAPSQIPAAAPPQSNHVDVLIIGAGLSGIGAAYHLQQKCPRKTYAILEGRDTLGGTWDLFRYPGIRSDSDMYTLGYSFRPWTNPKAIADGPSILAYVRDTAEEAGIDKHIRYGHHVVSAEWLSKEARWTVRARTASGEAVFTASFVFACAGYYDYEEGYTPDFPGRDRFKGEIVHPQKWGADVQYEGKRVVVIGSGATAVTLVPELAKKAAHVTMLQRSPTYVVSAPERDDIANWLREHLPPGVAYAASRWKNIGLSMAVYQYCRRFPDKARALILGQVEKRTRGKVDVKTHFTPSYNPWDQRLCLVPDADLFKALREGKASVVTDHIETFTETGIKLASGAELPADLIVTATGLKLKFMGGMALDVDGKRIVPSQTMAYKGIMFSDVPNLAIAIGYTNASWTLKCDLTCEYVCRLLNYMDEEGLTTCCPRRDPAMKEEPLMDFSSGYVQRSIREFPRQGTAAPWKLYQNYVLDRLALRHGKLRDDAMEFSRRGQPTASTST